MKAAPRAGLKAASCEHDGKRMSDDEMARRSRAKHELGVGGKHQTISGGTDDDCTHTSPKPIT